MKFDVILLFWILIISSGFCFSQRIAEFEYVFHFEDAIGNKDSVTIGYDPDASYESPNGCFDPEFGEVKLNHPFDSVFEVRVSHHQFNVRIPGPCNYFLKKAISKAVGPSTQPGCYTGGRFIFWMTNMYPPVTISWNQDDFLGNKCYTNSYIALDYWDKHLDFWWEGSSSNGHYCLAEYQNGKMWIAPEYDNHKNNPFRFETVFEIEGKGRDSVFGFVLQILPALSFRPRNPCHHIIPNSNENYSSSLDISIYPNPSMEVLNIEVEDVFISSFTISTISGEVVKRIAGRMKDIDISALEAGIYILKVNTESDDWIVKKFCKM